MRYKEPESSADSGCQTPVLPVFFARYPSRLPLHTRGELPGRSKWQGEAALMEGRTPGALLRRVAPSDGAIATLRQDCFSGGGGSAICLQMCMLEEENQSGAFSRANFLSDREAAGRGKRWLGLVLPELIVLTK